MVFFGTAGKVGDKLAIAHRLSASKKSAALRSFTTLLFNYKSKRSFPRANVKASDCTLMIKWISVLTAGAINEGPPAWQLNVLHSVLATSRLATSLYSHMCSHGMLQSRDCAAVLYDKRPHSSTGTFC